MKVICIDGVKPGDPCQNFFGPDVTEIHEAIFEGEIYNVINENVFLGEPCFLLSERSPFSHYRKTRFVPLSEIHETTFERKYNKELV